jgi:ELWxxDGT repeat protein
MPGVFASRASRGGFARVCVLGALALTFGLVQAAAPRLVLDINSQPASVSSNAVPIGTIGNSFYFFADAYPGSGSRALYKTDGTAAGTTLVTTLTNGNFEPPLRELVVAGGKGYFTATQSATGNELWVTDGTAAGTHIVIDLYTPASFSSFPRILGVRGTEVIFGASVNLGQQQIFLTDGTTAGTRPITPVYPAGTASVREALVSNGKIYLAFGDDISGGSGCCKEELWVTDGTVSGAHVISDSASTFESLQPRSLVQVGSSVLLTIKSNSRGFEVASLNTATDTLTFLEVASGATSSIPTGAGGLAPGNGFAMFVGGNGSDYELWRTDGTLAGTTRVADIAPGVASSISGTDGDITAVGGRAVFVADDGIFGKQLWGSDGTAQGTVRLTSAAAVAGWTAELLGVRGTRAYFAAGSGTQYQYISTDGTAAGTHVLTDLGTLNPTSLNLVSLTGDDAVVYFNIPVSGAGQLPRRLYKYETQPNRVTYLADSDYPTTRDLMAYGNGVLLFRSSSGSTGKEPWVSDGTVAGTHILKNLISDAVTENASPDERVSFGGKLWFAADDGVHGRELWQSDGTVAGTKLAFDVRPGAESSTPKRLFTWKDELYFFAVDASGASQLMRTNSGALQTLAALTEPPSFSEPDGVYASCQGYTPAELNGRLYFAAKDAQTGVELWSTDGTAAGTQRLLDLNPGAPWSAPCGLVPFKGRLYFRANAVGPNIGSAPRDLWSTDGTAAGTALLVSVNPVNPTFTNGGAVGQVFNDALYFMRTTSPSNVASLWKTDGTAAGTELVVAGPAAGGSIFTNGVANGKLLVLRGEGVGVTPRQYELLVSDGTTAGTVPLLATKLAPNSTLFLTDNRFYFSTDGAGVEPWVSDGTAAGTRQLKDINSTGDSNPSVYFSFNGATYFLAKNAASETTLWRTDGTPAGTVLADSTSSVWQVLSTAPVATSSGAFFTGRDPVAGIELFVFGNDAPVAANDSATSTNGAAIAINVLANDSDADGTLNAASVKIVSAPTHGMATVGASGSITFTPTAGYAGTDAFTYSVTDNLGNVSNSGTVSITVTQPAAPSGGGGGGSGGDGGGGGPLSVWDVLLLAVLLSGRWLVRRNRV